MIALKRWFVLVLAMLLALCAAATAETERGARAYALYLEEMLPEFAFSDAEVPARCEQLLGADYEFIARSAPGFGSYIAGVRRADARALSPDAALETQSDFSGQTRWKLTDGGEVVYDFIVSKDVQLYDFDHFAHLLIFQWPRSNPFEPWPAAYAKLHLAATAEGRAELKWMAARGLELEDRSRAQLVLYVHTLETWKAGITDQPSAYYVSMPVPDDLLGARSISYEQAERTGVVDLGVYMHDGYDSYHLVCGRNGVPGVVVNPYEGETRLYEAGPGYERLMQIAEEKLGYRPGDMDFLGKTSVRAVFEWADDVDLPNPNGDYVETPAGERVIEDAKTLRALDRALNNADFTIGLVNHPSPAFLTVEYADGTHASFAVAVNSFDHLFYRGVILQAAAGGAR